MKSLRIRAQHTVADPLQVERVLKALKLILEHQEDTDASSLLVTAHLGCRLPSQQWRRRQRQERRCWGVVDCCHAGRRQVIQHVTSLLA
jgi:hypothetical protein